MLSRIEIHDFALIEKMVMEPGQGFLVLTGETGAGKSILIDAISALLGERVSRDKVRHEKEQATIEAIFHIDPSLLPENLVKELGLSNEEGPLPELILSREISATGKSVCRINGRLSTLTTLRELASFLIDIHGQHDQQAIFKVDSHLKLLDRYGGEPISRIKEEYGQLLQHYQTCQKEMRSLGRNPEERQRQIDLLTYQVNEICAANIKPDEEEKLTARRRVLSHAEKIKENLLEAYERLAGETASSVLSGLGDLLSNLQSVKRHTDEMDDLIEAVGTAQDLLQTTASDLRAACEQFDSDPAELARLEERLDLLYRLKKKYGGSLSAVQSYLEKASERLEYLTGGEARYEQLKKEEDRLVVKLKDVAFRLSEERRKVASDMEDKVARELADLGMKNVRFSVKFEELCPHPKSFPDEGLDRIEFLLSANPGEPLRPLAQIASGGEASRIMLAIKSILADADQIPVLIFDEIDTGVSGRTAAGVGEKLMQLSRGRQIFCITHMAQIAAMADEHWLVEKQVDGGRTHTALRLLQESERESELARLISGGVANQTARVLAGQLRKQAQSLKIKETECDPATSENPGEEVP